MRVYDLDGPSCVLPGVGEEWTGAVICASLNGDRLSARKLSLGLRNYQIGRAVPLFTCSCHFSASCKLKAA